MPGTSNAGAPPPAPEAGEGDEKAMLSEILATLKALNAKLAGTEEVAKENKGVIVENEDKKSAPKGGETAGKPQSSLAATVETDPVINKELAEMKKQLAELKKDSDAVKAVRAPVDGFEGDENMQELKKEAIQGVLSGKTKGRIDNLFVNTIKKGAGNS